MAIKSAGTEPVLIRRIGRNQVSIPRDTGTGSIINAGRAPVDVFVDGVEFVVTLEPGDTWPRYG